MIWFTSSCQISTIGHFTDDTTPTTQYREEKTSDTSKGCVGDDTASFGNAEGLADPYVWESYVNDHILPSASIHGIAETNWSNAMAEKHAKALAGAGTARLYSAIGQSNARAGTNGTGCSLVIRSDIPRAKSERVILQREDGKALAVRLTWHSRRLLVLITHQKG